MSWLRQSSQPKERRPENQNNGCSKNTVMQRLRQKIYTEAPKTGRTGVAGKMNIIQRAFEMAEAVQQFFGKARIFYYKVVLLGHRCGYCNGHLVMIAEGRCRCQKCKNEFDPTVQFQRCSACGGVPVLRVRRYYCTDCGNEVTSRFVFETLPFEKDYFRQKMAESRQRKQQLKEKVRQMLSQSRSQAVAYGSIDLDSIPGLVAALNGLTQGMDEKLLIELKGKFDLDRYQTHIKAHLQDFPIDLRGIPTLIENARKDLIWRFIAAIFLEHEKQVQLQQKNQTIWVSHYVNQQGQDFSDSIEEIDGVEGLAC